MGSLSEDLTALEAVNEWHERHGDLHTMLRETADKGLIYWEPTTDRGAIALNNMLAKIERTLHPRERTMTLREECEAMATLLKDVRDNGLVYWEPNTSRGAERKADMLARIDRVLDGTPSEKPNPPRA